MSPIRAVFFDVGGTLAYPHPSFHAVIARVLAEHGVETTAERVAAVEPAVWQAIDEYWQHDVTYTAELPWETTLTAGVQNIFDAEPPCAIGTQYNYDPGSGNPLGRVFVVGLKKRF